MHDLVIRGANVVDGLGNPAQRADVAVKDGRIAAIGTARLEAAKTIDAGGLTLAPGIIDLHTHYDAQVTWDQTCSPSPALGVTTCIMGNCGFGIVPSPPALRETIIRNLAVVEGMDLESLRQGINWEFEDFAGYLAALRRRGSYPNLATFIGHSAVRTAVMGDGAWQRKVPSDAELAEMKRLVKQALQLGAIGFASSHSLNHSGQGGIPMPSTIADLSEVEHLAMAMREVGTGVLQFSSGATTVEAMEELARKTGRAMFMATGVAMYNEADPERGIGVFERCRQAHARGNGVYVQIPCQPLSFDFTLANAYPFFSHEAFAPYKAADEATLKRLYADPSFRAKFRDNLQAPRLGTIFKGNFEQVVIAAVALEKNQPMQNRSVAELAKQKGVDPLDLMFELSLEENLETAFLGKFLNVGDDGVARLLKHEAGVIALSDAGAHTIYFCDAGFGLTMLGKWVRERRDFTLEEGVRRLTSHLADLYGIKDRGRVAPGAFADLMLFDPATVGIGDAYRVPDLPGGGKRTLRKAKGLHGVFVNGVMVHDGQDYLAHAKGPGMVLDSFNPSRVSGRNR
ncbi:MAG: amidohydrolase family protein [Alphaproteobacteria bacterium]|nr:amidohydrolase family protein [Alphaproteobacteria bacterium]